MFFLLLAIVCSVMISITMRISEKYVKNEMGMFMTNYGVCMLLAFAFIQDKSQIGDMIGDAGYLTLALGVIAGILYLGNFVLLKFNMTHNGIVMSSIFMKLGVLVPTVMAVVVFHEVPRWTQVVGILIAVVAIILINFEKDAISEGKKKLWLLVLLLMSGFAEGMTNVFDELGNAQLSDGYLFATFGTAFLISIVLAIKGGKVTGKEVLFGALLGVPNYFFSRFLLQSLESVPAVLVYPTYSVTTIIIITIVGVVAFREVVSKKKLCALGLILLALVFLNI